VGESAEQVAGVVPQEASGQAGLALLAPEVHGQLAPTTSDALVLQTLGSVVTNIVTQLGQNSEMMEKYKADAAKDTAEAEKVRVASEEKVRLAEIEAETIKANKIVELRTLKVNGATKRQGRTLVAACGMILLVLALVVIALGWNKDAVATEVIKTVLSVLAGGLGGYGVRAAQTRQEPTRRDDEE
jgi:hypothetical protein